MIFPFWNMCEECGLSNGGDLSYAGAITMTEGTCPYCKQEEKALIPVVDFRWPWDTELSYRLRWD